VSEANVITIRQASIEDAELLAELGARTYSEAFSSLTSPADLATYLAQSFSIETLSAELADARSTFLIAVSEGVPVGYAQLRDSEAPECVSDKPAIELARFYAVKQWWGRGVGPLLMETCLRMARQAGYATIWLSCWKINDRGNAFYRKWQFREVGETTFIVGSDVQDDYILARSLKDSIGLLNEKPLHAALKQWYAQSNDRFEVLVDGFVIDIVRDDLLIEIQTGSFSKIKQKLVDLVARYPVRLVYPIAREKWLVKLPKEGKGQSSRRKSPKRGRIEEMFRELVSFPELFLDRNFSLEVLLIQEEEVRRYDGRRGWRRKGWVTEERRLLAVVEQRLFETAEDVSALMPRELPSQFTTSDLAKALGIQRWLAQKMAYCLREMGEITTVGKRGRSILYVRADSA
jgi:GNAT superfamily N-acetyltransferase/ribosomal protein S25